MMSMLKIISKTRKKIAPGNCFPFLLKGEKEVFSFDPPKEASVPEAKKLLRGWLEPGAIFFWFWKSLEVEDQWMGHPVYTIYTVQSRFSDTFGLRKNCH